MFDIERALGQDLDLAQFDGFDDDFEAFDDLDDYGNDLAKLKGDLRWDHDEDDDWDDDFDDEI